MGINALQADAQKAEFAFKYILDGYTLRVMMEGENLFKEEYKLGPNDYPDHTSFFRETGLQLPLWPLLVNFLRYTNLTLGQLSPM